MMRSLLQGSARKVLLTVAAVGVAAGTVTIGLGATGAATNRLTVNASGVVPGDTLP